MLTETQRITAAEHALGLLGPEDAWKAERDSREDPEFRAEVAWWEDRLARVLEDSEPVAPPHDRLPAIQARLFGIADTHGSDPVYATDAGNRTAESRPFPWIKLILGVLAVKAVLLSVYLYQSAAATEAFQVESRYGQSVVNWNARSGQIRLSGDGARELYLWLQDGKSFSYLGPGGETLAAGLAAGAVVVVSENGRRTVEPDVLARIVLKPH